MCVCVFLGIFYDYEVFVPHLSVLRLGIVIESMTLFLALFLFLYI